MTVQELKAEFTKTELRPEQINSMMYIGGLELARLKDLYTSYAMDVTVSKMTRMENAVRAHDYALEIDRRNSL